MSSQTAAPTLTEFLLARIAEDEARARTGRDIRECEAKRRIVDRHSGTDAPCSYCTDAYGDSAEGPCPDPMDLAAVYADHPDYRDKWRVF
jgi:hypothetical protein